ncbi:hypothetical protein MTR67_000447 [Solanum verrucosum]|uniref:Uncharacterized protein n=1 Tax=Solanum verrucosum TaxID=315347 RepID=A0AAF0PLU3_SOLVR|nr:hypothetical protein MTR67_000447 [Solanum verrucosum]
MERKSSMETLGSRQGFNMRKEKC